MLTDHEGETLIRIRELAGAARNAADQELPHARP